MKSAKAIGYAALASACALACLVILSRYGTRTTAETPGQQAAAAPLPGSAAAPLLPLAQSGPPQPQTSTVPPDTTNSPPLQAQSATPAKGPPATQSKPGSLAPPARGGAAVQDPLAREALSLVGADPNAEAYWIAAINDSRLSAEERQNLIEDLNEDGLSDPKHPTVEDLPLILNRLALIEALAPDAMDTVNLDAFAEAYKDLVNLAELAMGGGKPVN